MWIVRSYNSEDDELLSTYPLRATTLRHLVELLGYAPTQFGSTPLQDDELKRIAMPLGIPILDDREYVPRLRRRP